MSKITIDNVDAKSLSKEELVKLITEHQNLKKRKEKPQRPFDFSKHNLRKVAFKVSYIGWNYNGFQIQPNIKSTIEEELFSAFEKTRLIQDRHSCEYTRCGRTDRGVNALGQVIALVVRSNLSEGVGVLPNNIPTKHTQEIDYLKMLNGVLPPDIRIIGWCPVPKQFNARFSCIYRKYKYYFIKGDLDIKLMDDASKQFIGSHNFINFCKVNGEENNFERRIIHIQVKKSKKIAHQSDNERDAVYEIVVQGYSFLWHQVRCMAGILFLIGKKLEKPEIIKELLDVEKCKIKPQYNMASEYGLCLYDCGFEDLIWQQCENLENQMYLEDQIKEEWEKNSLLSTLWGVYHVNFQRSLVKYENQLIPWKDIRSKVDIKKRHINIMDRPTEESMKKKIKKE